MPTCSASKALFRSALPSRSQLVWRSFASPYRPTISSVYSWEDCSRCDGISRLPCTHNHPCCNNWHLHHHSVISLLIQLHVWRVLLVCCVLNMQCDAFLVTFPMNDCCIWDRKLPCWLDTYWFLPCAIVWTLGYSNFFQSTARWILIFQDQLIRIKRGADLFIRLSLF